jgi:hypothetical protein
VLHVLTFKTIATATAIGVLVLALLVALLGLSQGVTFAHDQVRALVGVRPF